MKFGLSLCIFALLSFPVTLAAQKDFAPGQLDPTRNITTPQLLNQGHTPLPEQYIWNVDPYQPGQTSAQENEIRTSRRYFRVTFDVPSVPPQSTLYIAGPETLEVYINGKLADSEERNPDFHHIRMIVFSTDISRFLHKGKNTLALMAIPRDILSKNEVRIVAKIVPAANGIDAPPILISGPDWKSTMHPGSNWQNAKFNDSSWKPVQAFGPIESSIEFLQGNIDSGLYRWPGYLGVSSFLAHTVLPVHEVLEPYRGRGSYSNLDALTQSTALAANKEFTVHLAPSYTSDTQAPSVLLDFGREVNGRLQFISDSDQPIEVALQYGESKEEAALEPYLSIDPVTILPHATAYGPKSSFRYAKVRFLNGGPSLRFRSIALDDIYYPVTYRGSFESSDPLVNRIWETGVYTAHLCMQDDIWDAPKRDRRRWAGDLDVSGRAIDDVFGDNFLMQQTMTHLIGETSVSGTVKSHVNEIPGYSAWWISEVTQHFLHSGTTDYLETLHQPLLQLLAYMDTEVDAKNLYANTTKSWSYVDWSPDYDGDTPEARRATQFEFYLAYRDGAYLLRQLKDWKIAKHYEDRAQHLRDASQKYLLDTTTNTYGPRWQTNAIAVYSSAADESQYAPIWDHVLSTVANTPYTALVMTPYYNYYIISAMAKTGHSKEALDWIRTYWGGMIQEGATSFWEAYYPSWPKNHASLQADGSTGYFVSLAHGWSSGPTAWMMEQILGIQPIGPGFGHVSIRPDLAGLTWAKGSEPTPQGLLKVELHQKQTLETTIDLPAGVNAAVILPVENSKQQIFINGKAADRTQPFENGKRGVVYLDKPGHYVLRAQ